MSLGNGRGVFGAVVRLKQPLPGMEPQRKGLGGGAALPAAPDEIWESTDCTWEWCFWPPALGGRLRTKGKLWSIVSLKEALIERDIKDHLILGRDTFH